MLAVKEELKIVPLDAYEEGAVIEGLNRLRTEQLEHGADTAFVSDVMLKVLQAPIKKTKVRDGSR